jgi:hypothetical protein
LAVNFDTTATYLELEEADDEVARNWRGEQATSEDDADPDKTAGLGTHGKSKDSRDDLPQVVIGLAVTRQGIPVRCWCWPGNTSDQALLRRVKQDLRDWALGKVIWVADRGFASATNRRFLQQGTGGYLIGDKLRSASPHVKAALSRQGRYQQAASNLQVAIPQARATISALAAANYAECGARPASRNGRNDGISRARRR